MALKNGCGRGLRMEALGLGFEAPAYEIHAICYTVFRSFMQLWVIKPTRSKLQF